MNNLQNHVSTLVERIRLERVFNRIKPPIFESAVFKLFEKNEKFLEAQRLSFRQLDCLDKYRGVLEKIASEAKHTLPLRDLIDNSAVAQMAAKAVEFNIGKGHIVTNSALSEAVKSLVQQQRIFFDRPEITRLLEKQNLAQIEFASSLLKKLNNISLRPVLTYEYPDTRDIQDIEVEEIKIDPAQKSALISVDKLPLKVISMILQNPQEVRNITPRQFEEFIASLLDQLGFSDIVLTPRSSDGGKDIIASHSINGIPLSFYFECKQYAKGNKIQLETLRALLGTIAHDSTKANMGVLVTTSTFTKGCEKFILAESRLDGKDYDDIVGWISELKT